MSRAGQHLYAIKRNKLECLPARTTQQQKRSLKVNDCKFFKGFGTWFSGMAGWRASCAWSDKTG